MRSSSLFGQRFALMMMFAAGGVVLGAVTAMLSPNIVTTVLSLLGTQ
jgi:hypothetical protein